MSDALEAPGSDSSPGWASLYRARSDEVVAHRPVFTGDVFEAVNLPGEELQTSIVVLQHPCAMRIDGITLAPRLLVAEVKPASSTPLPSKWVSGFFKQFPLPELKPAEQPSHYTANLTMLQIVTPSQLESAVRIACLSQLGVNLLMQRWVHHNSRAVVGTQLYQEVSSPQFEEADIFEEWCLEREDDGLTIEDAGREIHAWLTDSTATGVSPQESLKEPQHRSQVRKAMRQHLKQVRSFASGQP